MGKETIDVLIEGGKATAAPPLGPSIAPLKINVQAVVDKINEKTKDMAGMQVPVKVIVNTDTKEFEIEVGTPPVSALIKKELNIAKGAKDPGVQRIADLTMDQVKKIARAKFGKDDKSVLSQVEGTARSMGITVGQGTVTAEEKQKYDDLEKAKEEEQAAKDAAHAAADAGAPAAGAEGADKADANKPEAGADAAKPADDDKSKDKDKK